MTCILCEDIEDVLFEKGLWCPMCRDMLEEDDRLWEEYEAELEEEE